jgi:hypothetical protein
MSHTKERNARWLGMSHAQLVMECQDLCKQRDGLLAAIKSFGHKPGCRKNAFGDECSCGVDAVIARAQGNEA